jgi:hypothetical protein
VLTGKKTNFDPVLKATVWCINAKENMYGMPIWGTTVEYYCEIAKGATALNSLLGAPPFAGIPQHLCDHDLYNKEVEGHLLSVDGACNSAGHDLTADDIAGMLDTLSDVMLDELKERGSTRTKGTDSAWKNAVKAADQGQELPGWYLPFSMAEAPRKRGFPLKGTSKSLRGWIRKIGKALSKSI